MRELSSPPHEPVTWSISWPETVDGRTIKHEVFAVGQTAFSAHRNVSEREGLPAFGTPGIEYKVQEKQA